MLSPLYYGLRLFKHINYFQLLYDNIVCYNFYENNYITHYHINRLSLQIKECIYHSLFNLTKYDIFYKPEYISIYNQRTLLPYSEQIRLIESYKKYPLIYNNLYCYIEISNVNINDKPHKINKLFEKKIIFEKAKEQMLFNICNIIDNNSEFGHFINEILKYNNNDYYVYNNMKDQYIKYYKNLQNTYKFLNITKNNIDIIMDYKYLTLLNILSTAFKYIHSNRYMLEVQILIDKTYNQTLLTKIHTDLLLKKNTYIYNSSKQLNYLHNNYDIQLQNFNETKDVISYFDILAILYTTKQYDKMTIFINNNFNYIKIFANHKTLLENTLPLVVVMCLKNYDNNLTEKLTELFYNEILIYTAKRDKKYLVPQKPNSKSRSLYDNIGNTLCLICLEQYDDQNVILCLNCNKYIYHYICFNKLHNKVCPYCKKL
jgi:hypothetical protein